MKKLLLTLAMTLVANSALAYPVQEVMVGGDANHDPCSWGIVTVATTLFRVENESSKFDTAKVNQEVYICDYHQDVDGDYIGVIFSERDDNCELSSPIPNRRAYRGACKSGFVKKEFVLMIAG